MAEDIYRQFVRQYGLTKPDAYTPYAAGMKMYGGGRSNPTSGPVDKQGYLERDLMNRARRNAVLSKLKAEQSGRFASPEYLKGLS